MASKARILIIDDDVDTLMATQLLLQTRGFDVTTAASPDDGLRRLEQEKPDVVLLDVMMPDGIEGFQWLWSLRKHPDAAVRDVPVIVASSIHKTTSLRFRQGDADESGEYLPIQAFLDKPVDPDVLVRKIEGILGAG